MLINNKCPKLVMNLQLFAEKGDDTVDSTDPRSGFEYDESFFTGHKEDETPDWLKEDDENEEEEDDTAEKTEVEDDGPEDVPEDVKQNDKANSAFAELRRQKKALEQQTKANDAWAVKNFGHLGVKDFDSYKVMMDEQLADTVKQELEESGYDVDLLHKAMKLDPTYKAILDAQPPKQESSLDEDKLVADYTSLQEKYSDLVTKPEDIPQEVWNRYDKGYDLVEAFEIVNRDKLSQKVAKKTKEMTRQETLNKINSKKHLQTEKDNGSKASDVYIDKETMAMYKNMGLSEKQAVKFHKKYMNQ
jgi:hypothetical protein